MTVYVLTADPDWGEVSVVLGVYQTRAEAEAVRREATKHPKCYETSVEEFEIGSTRDIAEALD